MNWEYREHPQHFTFLTERTVDLYKKLIDNSIDIKSSILDTRGVHKYLFEKLTPPQHEHFAGHYRGENFEYLKNYVVCVPGNPNVGFPPQIILKTMQEFREAIERNISQLDSLHQSSMSLGQKIRKSVSFSCAAFVKLGQIHPYANGNGHIARYILIASLKRYGYDLIDWPLDPRPTDPPYTSLIRSYEKGDKEPLQRWILERLNNI